jgi:hypothetical protein
VGLLIAPLRTFRAFARGRRSRSLYSEPLTDELLSTPVGSARTRLGISSAVSRGTIADVSAFVGTSILGVLTLVLLVGLAPVFILIGWFWQ